MDLAELRQRVGAILAVEVRADEAEDWTEVQRLADELRADLSVDRTICPEIVDHYLDDVDVRVEDERYAARQRDLVRRFVETGEHQDGTRVPLWGCAVIWALLLALILWLRL